MPRHATERSLSVNALKKRSAGKSITPVLSPNRLSEWRWESMAHSLKQGILGRAKGISLRFSPGASRHRGEAFSVVWDVDPDAKRRVQAVLRRLRIPAAGHKHDDRHACKHGSHHVCRRTDF